jgi:hypothetical protein
MIFLFRLPNLTHLIVTSPETVGNLFHNNDILINIIRKGKAQTHVEEKYFVQVTTSSWSCQNWPRTPSLGWSAFSTRVGRQLVMHAFPGLVSLHYEGRMTASPSRLTWAGQPYVRG